MGFDSFRVNVLLRVPHLSSLQTPGRVDERLPAVLRELRDDERTLVSS